MSTQFLRNCFYLVCSILIIISCQGNRSTNINHHYPTKSDYPYSSDADLIYKVTREIILNSSTPIVKQKDSIWDRGYEEGWEVGYEDAINGDEYMYNYDDTGKEGLFLDGYINGYDDGYNSGKEELANNYEDSNIELEEDEFDD